MSDNLIELLKVAANMPLSRIQDDEECADSLTVLCGRAAEALASLQQRNLLFMREREEARKDANKYQSLAAELSDKLNGTPCAEIRWQQERDTLRAALVKAGEALEKSRVFTNGEFLRRSAGDDESYDEDEQAIPLLCFLDAALTEIRKITEPHADGAQKEANDAND